MESAFVLVYPQGLELGRAAYDALDRAGIAHCRGTLPARDARRGAAAVVYVIDEARLLSLGPRETVEHALELIARAQAATTVVLAERGSDATLAGGKPVRRRLDRRPAGRRGPGRDGPRTRPPP